MNAGTNFEGRPVGNHQEHMPWDLLLNKDVENWVQYQVVLTGILLRNKNGDWPKEKLISSTPKPQDRAYLRVVDPALGPNAGAPLGHASCKTLRNVMVKT